MLNYRLIGKMDSTLEEISNLQTVIDQYFRGMDADKMAKDSGNSHQLCLNTEEAAGRGAFGVPR